jgi:hypothetical protein
MTKSSEIHSPYAGTIISLLTGKLSGNFRKPGIVDIGNDSIPVAVIE